jgi:hypothetical protein
MAVNYLASGYMPQIDPNEIQTTQPSIGLRLRGAAKGLLGNRDLALALLANSSGPAREGFGSILGRSMQQADQSKRDRTDEEFKRQYMQAQMAAMQGKNQNPSSVKEYEYAKQNGFKGSFQEWVVAGGQSSRPSAVQEWEHYVKLMEDDQKNGTKNAQLYLEMKRNPNFTVKDVNQVPTSIQQSIVGGVNTRPLSNLPQTAAAAETVKQAEGRGGAVGKAEGEITGGVLTKGSNAKSTIATLALADPLIDAATGSMVGAGRDRLLAAFGEAPTSAQAIAQLRVLQANLMTSMPRMEGPQSDKDVELYRQAAGQIGDPTIPASIKKAAVKTIRALQNKYIERAGGGSAGASGLKVGTVEDGYRYKGGDPANPANWEKAK